MQVSSHCITMKLISQAATDNEGLLLIRKDTGGEKKEGDWEKQTNKKPKALPCFLLFPSLKRQSSAAGVRVRSPSVSGGPSSSALQQREQLCLVRWQQVLCCSPRAEINLACSYTEQLQSLSYSSYCSSPFQPLSIFLTTSHHTIIRSITL